METTVAVPADDHRSATNTMQLPQIPKSPALIVALSACAYCVSTPADMFAQQPVVVAKRLDNGNLVLQEDPRERARRDDSYSVEFIQELYPFSENESEQWSRLQSGITQFRNGDPPKARATWNAIASVNPDSDVAVAALWNIGQVQHHAGKLTSAIASYKRALAASVKSTSKHYVAIDLSHAHLQLQQLQEAVKAAQLAKTQYPPDSFCGICHMSQQQRISKYIATLQQAMSQKRTVRLQTKSEWNTACNAATED